MEKFRNSKLRFKLLLWDKHGPVFQWSDREKMILEALRFVRANKINGDYFEFGVGEGYTLSSAMRIARALKMDMFFHGFDSFEGLPDTSEYPFTKGMYRFEEELVMRKLPSLHNVELHKVWFSELKNGRFRFNIPSIVWVDCDLYESTKPVLNWILPELQEGTIICFDDWNCFRGNPYKGEQRAFFEWQDDLNDAGWDYNPFLDFGWHGTSFIITRLQE